MVDLEGAVAVVTGAAWSWTRDHREAQARWREGGYQLCQFRGSGRGL